MKAFGAVLILTPLFCGSVLRAQLIDHSMTNIIAGASTDAVQIAQNFHVESSTGEDNFICLVTEFLTAEGEGGSLLRPSADRISFPMQFPVGGDSLVFPSDGQPGSSLMLLMQYSWKVQYPGSVVTVHPARDWFPGQTNILIGFSRPHPDGTGAQYGWVRLERETANTKDIFRPDGSERRVAFWPAGSAVHPIPDRPIRAGEAPDLPQLVSEMIPPEPGQPARIRISWAAGWDTMRLEQSADLTPPILWSPVPEVSGSAAEFPLPEDGQLFLRLVHVP